MAGIALPLSNVILGLAKIGAGIGFGAAEQNKMNELDEKSKKLSTNLNTAGNFYDHIYFPISVNLKRVKKSLDKLPNNMISDVQKHVIDNIKKDDDDDTEEALATVASVLGYIETGITIAPDFLQVIAWLRNRKAEGESGEPVENSFELVPMGSEQPPEVPVAESSLPETPALENVETGLGVAAVVFGVAGLAATIGLGVWTLDKLNEAISSVDKKQEQVSTFLSAMKKALDPVVSGAGLAAGNYGKITTTVMPTWKKAAEDFESYAKAMYYAIRGYIMGKPESDIKNLVEKESDTGMPYPEAGYVIAKQLATTIKDEISLKKTDKEIVAYIATIYPDENLRFVVDEYFVGTLRSYVKVKPLQTAVVEPVQDQLQAVAPVTVQDEAIAPVTQIKRPGCARRAMRRVRKFFRRNRASSDND